MYVLGQQEHVELLLVILSMEQSLFLNGAEQLSLGHLLRLGIIAMSENNFEFLGGSGSCRGRWRGRRGLLLDEILLHLHHVPELNRGPIVATKL